MVADAEMLSVVPGKELGGAALSALGALHTASGAAHSRTGTDVVFAFGLFRKSGNPSDFFWLVKIGANVGL